MKERICKKCGCIYMPTSTRQQCCNKLIQTRCIVCGKEMEGRCTLSPQKITCSKGCQTIYSNNKKLELARSSTKICKWCGKEFTPSSSRDEYCKDKHYQICAVCGNEFEIDVKANQLVKTCSKECRYKAMIDNTDKQKAVEHHRQSLLEKYGVDNSAKIVGSSAKSKLTCLSKYGSEHYSQTQEYKDRVRCTSIQKYGSEHHLSSEQVRQKIEQTNLSKYGWINMFGSHDGQSIIKSKMVEKYGFSNPSQIHEFKAKATKSARTSKLELRIENILKNYEIEYIHPYFISDGTISHEFDFYLRKYNLLIDADGLYFHSYLDDPNGKQVRDDYDEIRLKLIPEGAIFHVIVEGDEDSQIHDLINVIEECGGSLSKYDSYLFKWCRSIEFPYPRYDERRLQNDWKHLNEYSSDEYKPTCRIGESIIKQFHPSVYNCHVGSNISPYEGWYDDTKLKQVIRNRLIYKNTVDPSKILSGFNISKIAPCVSIFNPILTKYLVNKYLQEFNVIFDPFSGFSGRMLGTASCNKQYIGQDINSTAVAESNKIIEYLKLGQTCKVSTQDTLNSQGEYECLLTCPPYNKKEIYSDETVFMSCEDWITECLRRFKCKRYVFVVDDPGKYIEYVCDEIHNASHFSKSNEYVVAIEDLEHLRK